MTKEKQEQKSANIKLSYTLGGVGFSQESVPTIIDQSMDVLFKIINVRDIRDKIKQAKNKSS
jgi:hypothetical protein